MSQIVEYVLSLRDDLSRGIEGANVHVNQLESSLLSAKSTIGSLTGMLGTLGVGFALFKGGEFIHEGVEAFHALEQVTAKVEANLKSSGEAAGLNMSDITDMAKNLSKQVQFSRAEVMDMQSQLLTFPTITKNVFEESMSMVTDIAKQVNHGLSETALMFGKAFHNPEHGLKKLVRYGVELSDAQQDMIIKLQQSGHLVQAQQTMLEQIALSGYGGVAKAMAKADPLFQYNKTMGSVKMTVGELSVDLLNKLAPALEIFANSVKSATDWIKRNKSEFWVLIKTIGSGIVAFKTMTMIIAPLATGLATVAPAATSAVIGLEAVGIASAFALGPIVVLTAAITGIIYLYGLLDVATKNMQDNRTKKLNEAAEMEITHDNASLAGAISIGQKKSDAIKQIFDERMDYISGRRKALEAEWKNQALSPFGENQKEFADDWNFKKSVLDAQEKSLKTLGTNPAPLIKTNKAAVNKADAPPPPTKAVGSKSVTINVAIKSLINEMHITTTNLKETGGKVREVIANILAEAVNDFQIVATGV